MKAGINIDTHTVSLELTDGEVTTVVELEPYAARLLAIQLISSAEVIEDAKRTGLIQNDV